MIDLRHRSDAARIARLEAEVEALRTEALQSRLILDNATEHAIITLNLGGRIVGWNAGAENLLGYSFEEAFGQSGEIFFTPEDREQGVFITELCLALDKGRAVNERWHLRGDGSRFWASGVMLPLRDAAGETSGFLNIMCDKSHQQAEIERRSLLQKETQHRMRNTLTVVHALAVQTARVTSSVDAFAAAFGDRMQVLARSHDMLSANSTPEAWLHQVIDDSLAGFGGHTERVHIRASTAFLLPENAINMLRLALHELGTNAIKHGALSTPAGWVEVSWLQIEPATQDMLELVWHELGGPAVALPQRSGSGLKLFQHDLVQQFGGEVKLSFKPEGLECRIVLPARAGVPRS